MKQIILSLDEDGWGTQSNSYPVLIYKFEFERMSSYIFWEIDHSFRFHTFRHYGFGDKNQL